MDFNTQILIDVVQDENAPAELKLLIQKFLESHQENTASEDEFSGLWNAIVQDYASALPPELLPELLNEIETASGGEAGHGRFQDALYLEVPHVDLSTGQSERMDSVEQLLDNPLEGFVPFLREVVDAVEEGVTLLSSVQNTMLVTTPESDDASGNDFKYQAITEARNIDGTDNNLSHAEFGSTGQSLLSVSGYDYDDGYSTPTEIGLPNAREVSNAIFAQSGDVFDADGVANLFWVWGQFVDHDITLTRGGEGEAYNIAVPTGDPYFDPFGTGTQSIGFTRSGYAEGTGEDIGNPREQVNDITAFLDASNVYGSDAGTESLLRGEGGKMLTSGNNLLPTTVGAHGPEFLAGDERANENVALTSMHTLFVREHNRWVDVLSADNPSLTDEELYQTAKAIVSAEIQHITYDEFLPLLLGEDALGDYQGYDSTIDPQMSREFSTSAYRFGHTMLSSDVFRFQEDGSESDFGHLTLRDAFFRPDKVMFEGGIDEVLRGIAGSFSQGIDVSVIDDVRNFLFGPPGAGGFDLVALNIQRGRDQGIPDYNTAREAFGLDPVDDFSDITSDPVLASKLAALYGSVDNIDLWVAGLMEETFGESMLGETFHAIVLDQFTRIRDADRFWYENDLDASLIDEIQNTSLADLILRNTNTDFLQDDVFHTAVRLGGDDGDNSLTGTDQNDLIIGFDGNDIIDSGAGADTLYGGEGIDLFLFTEVTAFEGVDVIRDFSVAEGDLLDVSDVLSAADLLSENILDFIKIVQGDEGTTIQIDIDGAANTHAFQDIVFLESANDVTLDSIIYLAGGV